MILARLQFTTPENEVMDLMPSQPDACQILSMSDIIFKMI